ncbi:MAG: sugar transferase, partial [Novosphingobium sp.]|nr:sugar transferase [Novosphingobium sp.]
DDRYWERHALKPGLTGLAQIRGHRGATEHEEDLARRLESDLEYLDGWSLWRDLGIVVRTVLVLRHDRAF